MKRAAKAGILLAALGLLVTATRSAQAAGLSISGSNETTIRYADGKWFGQNNLLLSIGMSQIYLRWYNPAPSFWSGFDTIALSPDSIALTNKGSLWSDGPAFSGTLGDFKMVGPKYMAGPTPWPPAESVRGVLLAGFPAGKLTASAYFGWPRYSPSPLSSGPSTRTYGGALNIAKLGDLKVDLYGAARTGQLVLPPIVVAPNGQEAPTALVNPSGGAADQLNLYTRRAPSSPNQAWWRYVEIADDGTLLAEIDYPGTPSANPPGTTTPPPAPSPTSAYGYLLAGHGVMAEWIAENLTPYVGTGAKIQLLHPTTREPVGQAELGQLEPYAETVGALEASYKLAGVDLSAKVGRQAVAKGKDASPVFSGFRLVTASTPVDVGRDLATKPLLLTLSYRDIDRDFLPWAASRETRTWHSNYNYVYHHRNERGFHFTASTAIFPSNPVDIILEADTYVPKDAPTSASRHSESVTLATKLAGFAVKSNFNNSNSSLTISRELPAAPVFQKVTPTYTLTIPPSATLKHELKVDSTLSLGALRNISATFTYSLEGSTSKSSIAAKYTAPNGWALDGKWTQPNDASDWSDSYARLMFKVSF